MRDEPIPSATLDVDERIDAFIQSIADSAQGEMLIDPLVIAAIQELHQKGQLTSDSLLAALSAQRQPRQEEADENPAASQDS